MAKRTNIERIITAEIEKGNVYVIPGGNFVSAEMLDKEVKAEYQKAVNEPDFDMNMTLATFKENKLSGMKKAEDLLAFIKMFFDTDLIDAENVPELNPDKQKKGADVK